MALGALAVFPIVGVLLSSSLADHGREDDWRRCASADAQVSIAGCTALIAAGREIAADQATVFDNRGLAYLDLKLFDRAVGDFDAALRARPDDAGPLLHRGIARQPGRPVRSRHPGPRSGDQPEARSGRGLLTGRATPGPPGPARRAANRARIDRAAAGVILEDELVARGMGRPGERILPDRDRGGRARGVPTESGTLGAPSDDAEGHVRGPSWPSGTGPGADEDNR